MTDHVRYIAKCTAISVEERFASSWDDATKAAKQISLGWYVRVSESSAVFVGSEKPDIKTGDKLRLVLEHDK